MWFVTRESKVWEVPEATRATWIDTYRGVNVELELRKAAVWLDANPGRRKTAKGMPRFLVAWLNRVRPIQEPKGLVCPHDPPCRLMTGMQCAQRTTFGETRWRALFPELAARVNS